MWRLQLLSLDKEEEGGRGERGGRRGEGEEGRGERLHVLLRGAKHANAVFCPKTNIVANTHWGILG